MNVIVRLYWQHDLDLVALTLHPMFEMGKWMKKAMIAYAQGDEEFHIPLPPEMPPEKPLENSDAHFALDPKNEIENEVIKILQQFRNGQRNSVIKLIFRNYLDELFLKPYIDTNTYIVKARGNYGGKKKEIITNFERVSDHCSNIAVCLVQVNEDEFDTHAYLDELRQEDNKDFQSKVLACREKYQLPPTKQERLAEKNAKLLAE